MHQESLPSWAVETVPRAASAACLLEDIEYSVLRGCSHARALNARPLPCTHGLPLASSQLHAVCAAQPQEQSVVVGSIFVLAVESKDGGVTGWVSRMYLWPSGSYRQCRNCNDSVSLSMWGAGEAG